jgi:hypothetical protein
MSTAEYSRKLNELDRLLNDPDVPIQPDRIWSLLADVFRPDVANTPGSGDGQSEWRRRLAAKLQKNTTYRQTDR